jgi:HD-like signal output (HDOD) protein
MSVKRAQEISEEMSISPASQNTAREILEVVSKGDANLEEIGDTISLYGPLSARVLQVINSPLYGIKTRIMSVPHAVRLLGAREVKNLVYDFFHGKEPQR